MKKAILITVILALILAVTAAALPVTRTCPREDICSKPCRYNAPCPMYADEDGDGICDGRAQDTCPMQNADCPRMGGHHGQTPRHGGQNAMPCWQ